MRNEARFVEPPAGTSITRGLSLLAAGFALSVAAKPSPVCAAGSAGLRAGEAPSYLLWDISPLGIDPSTSELLVEVLLGELERVLGDRLIREEGIIDVNTRHIVAGCDDAHECLVDAGLAANADRVLVGVVSSLGDMYQLDLKVIDTRTRKALNRIRVSLKGDRDVLLPAMQQLVLKLIDPALLSGTLVVDVPLAGVSVFIDGLPVGLTPLGGPFEKVPVGEHTLKLSSPMIEDYFSFFKINYGKTTEVRVSPKQIAALQAQIQASEKAVRVPVYNRWWFWTILAGGAAVIAGGAALAVAVAQGGPDELPAASLGTVSF